MNPLSEHCVPGNRCTHEVRRVLFGTRSKLQDYRSMLNMQLNKGLQRVCKGALRRPVRASLFKAFKELLKCCSKAFQRPLKRFLKGPEGHLLRVLQAPQAHEGCCLSRVYPRPLSSSLSFSSSSSSQVFSMKSL